MSTVFNQYYFDVLKKLRALARERKEDSREARGVLKAVKRHYLSWDKDSGEYREWFNEADSADGEWGRYASLENTTEALEAWSSATTALLYKDMPVTMVRDIFKDGVSFHYFAAILCVLRRDDVSGGDSGGELLKTVLNTLKAIAKETDAELATRIAAIESDEVRHLMKRAAVLHASQRAAMAAAAAGAGGAAAAGGLPNFSGLEDTSLGRLAKEIMDEVNVDDLQKSVGEDGDILKALANPDSGLLKLVGTVSQKMVSKMASGELNQENLLSDALQFATKMGGNIPGLGNLAGMGDMLSSLMGGGGGGGDGDDRPRRGGGARPGTAGGGGGAGGMDMQGMLSSLMGMMGGGGMGGMGGAMGGGMGGAAGGGAARARPNVAAANQHLRRKTQARSMRDRLAAKRKENAQGEGADAGAGADQ